MAVVSIGGLKVRVDQALVDRGLCESRAQAQRAIMAGQVRVNGHPSKKASDLVRAADQVQLLEVDRYVGRGGHKLEHALKHFALDVTGARCVDLGSSTGGFTDCLLQHGASRVWAVDVGTNQLVWKLRSDSRVVSLEQTNARNLTPASFGPNWALCDVVVADCSFISLRRILPAAAKLLRPGGSVIALVKPQFEAGKADVDLGEGVITDPAIHARVLVELEKFVSAELASLRWGGMVESPLLGPAGNKEFLVLLQPVIL